MMRWVQNLCLITLDDAALNALTKRHNGIKPDFNKVTIIKNADLEFVIANQWVQVSKVRPFMSKSKRRRLEKKCDWSEKHQYLK